MSETFFSLCIYYQKETGAEPGPLRRKMENEKMLEVMSAADLLLQSPSEQEAAVCQQLLRRGM